MNTHSSRNGAWLALQADAKTYITLAAGLLGVTATFSERLFSEDLLGRIFLFSAWAFIALSILAGAYASGRAFSGLASESDDHSGAVGFLDLTVFLIGIGVGLLALAAWRSSTEATADTPSVALAAKSVVAEMTGLQPDALRARRIELDHATDVYSVEVLTDESTPNVFEVQLTAAENRILSATEAP